jgi:hypothetical protein
VVVLADQYDGQLPERGHVKRLEQLPLVSRTITIQVERDGALLPVPLRERDVTAERQLRADDAVPTEEVGVPLVKVHGAALPPGAPVPAAHELGEGGDGVPAAREVGAVVAVGGDDGVGAGDGGLHADGDGLLAVVEVAEPADELGLVERVGRDLEPPHERHVAEEGDELAGRGGGVAGRRVHDVRLEGHRGFYGDRVCGVGDAPRAGEQREGRHALRGGGEASAEDGRGHGSGAGWAHCGNGGVGRGIRRTAAKQG